MSKVIGTFVFSLRRHRGPGSSESTGGRCSLQGLTHLTHTHRCLCFPPDCKYSVNKHWMSVSWAARLVICVPRRQTRQVQVSDPLAAAGCNLWCTHSASVIGILSAQVTERRCRETTHCLTSCVCVRRISCCHLDQTYNWVSFVYFLLSAASSQRHLQVLHNPTFVYGRQCLWEAAGCDRWGNHPLFPVGGSYNHLCTLLLLFSCSINELCVCVCVKGKRRLRCPGRPQPLISPVCVSAL